MKLPSILCFSLYVIYLALGVLPDSKIPERPILKISTKTHDRHVIMDALQDVADIISLTPTNNARLQHWTTDSMRTCVENSNIKYYLRSVKLTDRLLEASECRTNVNYNYQSILVPSPNIHVLLLQQNDPIDIKLVSNLMEYFGNFEQFKEFNFNDFHDLNYDLQCVINYQELMQVRFKETILEVLLEKKVEVDDHCDFRIMNHRFPGYHYDQVIVNLPINGTFYCHHGKTKTCNRTIAEYKNSRYKLIE